MGVYKQYMLPTPRFNDDPKYTSWIVQNVGDCRWAPDKRDGVIVGLKVVGLSRRRVDGEPFIQRCDHVAPLMAKAFPELSLRIGGYRPDGCNYWLYHCWLVDSEGRIVDPTGRQFDRHHEVCAVDSYRNGRYLPAKKYDPQAWALYEQEEPELDN